MNQFFARLFTTRGGWMIIGFVVLAAILYFQPQMLAEMIKTILASLINLIGLIITGILNGIAHVLQANQQSLEYLFCILLLCVGIIWMLRAILKRGGSAKK